MPASGSAWRRLSSLAASRYGWIALATLIVPAALAAQGVQRGNCTLIWEPTTADTRSVSLREGQDAYVTHVSGGMLWTCGTATMLADSAVKYDLARRVDLIGSVRYRDTIRTLESGFLTYFELDDRVVATDSVHLTRLGDGSTLTGPRVEFLRAITGVDAETIATGRPHMVLYPEGDDPGPPFDVDADRTIFAGEEEARAFGDVIITRPDLHAESDSATFRVPDGTGMLYGSPWVEAENITLRGDTIRTHFEENVLRNVGAIGQAHAQGESFEVRSEQIDVAVEDEEVDAVWAHGDGLAEAISGDQHLYGDSLRFAMFEGQLDTINAVGRAAAIQGQGPARFDQEAAADSGIESGEDPPAELGAQLDPVVADTARAPDPAAEDSVRLPDPVVADTARAPDPAAEDSVRLPDPVVADTARAPDPAAEDSVRLPDPITADTIGVAGQPSPEPAEEAPPEEGTGAQTAPSTARGEADESVSQQAAADTTSDAESKRPDDGPRLQLPTDDDSNWVTGDTLYAIFEREPRAAEPSPPDSVMFGPTLSDSGITVPAAADSAAAVADPDSAANPVLEQLIVIGNARSLYAQVRDTTASAGPSRNYMIGLRIDIFFRDGEPERVEGIDAIGLYLEPLEPTEGQGPETGIVPVPEDTTSIGAREDTTGVSQPPDSSRSMAVRNRRGGPRSTANVRRFSPAGERRSLPDPRPREPIRAMISGVSTGRASRGRSGPPPSRTLR
jgi:hypothetical protein